jgi:POT family proton-dependent oligopeptide transporter
MFTSASLYDSNMSTAKTFLWIALGVQIIGNGFFKPNISSMVGSLYPKGDNRLDSAFTIFYLGINLGALIGITICPILGDVKVGDVRDLTAFKWGFLAAGIAMMLGTIVFFVLKNKYIVTPEGKPIGAKPVFTGTHNTAGESEKANFTNKAIAGVTLLAVVLTMGFHYLG